MLEVAGRLLNLLGAAHSAGLLEALVLPLLGQALDASNKEVSRSLHQDQQARAARSQSCIVIWLSWALRAGSKEVMKHAADAIMVHWMHHRALCGGPLSHHV